MSYMKKALFTFAMIVIANTLSYSQSIDNASRLFSLSKIWHDVSNNFYDPHKLRDIGWDSLYVSYIPLVEQAASDSDYYRLLERFMVAVEDGHTEFYAADKRQQPVTPPKYLPITGIDYLAGKFYITGWVSKFFPGLELPQELVAINGLETEQYLKQYIMPYVPGSTLQWRISHAFQRLVTTEVSDAKFTFKLRSHSGQTTESEVSYCVDSNDFKTEAQERLQHPVKQGSNIYRAKDDCETDFFLFDIKTFNNIPITNILQAVRGEVEQSKYIVVDLRYNGGGNEFIADTLLMSMLDVDTLKTYPSQHRTYDGQKAAYGLGYIPEYRDYYENTSIEVSPSEELVKAGAGLPTFTQPLYVLIGPQTFSAAEDFIIPLLIHYKGRATLVGTPTGGSSGAPLVKFLPDGSAYRVCTRGVMGIEGFAEKGIQPDIYHAATIDDYISGEDSIFKVVANHFNSLK